MVTVQDEQDEGQRDGRTARRDRNRDAVLDAVLDLFGEDCLAPAAQDVAARSGVSLRSVYRYYDDMEDLIRQAIARNVDKARPLFALDCLGEGSLADRIERIVSGRLALHDAMAPTMRAALLRARSNELIARQIEVTRGRLLQQVEQMFEPELRALGRAERTEVAASLDVLLGFESIEHLRRRRGFGAAATNRTLTRAVSSILLGALEGDR